MITNAVGALNRDYQVRARQHEMEAFCKTRLLTTAGLHIGQLGGPRSRLVGQHFKKDGTNIRRLKKKTWGLYWLLVSMSLHVDWCCPMYDVKHLKKSWMDAALSLVNIWVGDIWLVPRSHQSVWSCRLIPSHWVWPDAALTLVNI